MKSELDNWRRKLGLLEYQRTVSADMATQLQLDVMIAVCKKRFRN
jgi:hypothetical protein